MKKICKVCKKEYKLENGIPLLYELDKPNDPKEDVTEIIKKFYEELMTYSVMALPE